jgi:hypothetical protein
MRVLPTVLLVALTLVGPVAADTPLSDTRAFEYANAMSYYGFDACGDGLGGRLYRQALAAKFAQCPFSPDARAALAQRERLQARKSRAAIQHVIDEQGGLPVQLEGMTRTCHAQAATPEYQALTASLQRFASGEASVDAVIPQPCDAPSLVP